jgi:FG-GAP-like repeat
VDHPLTRQQPENTHLTPTPASGSLYTRSGNNRAAPTSAGCPGDANTQPERGLRFQHQPTESRMRMHRPIDPSKVGYALEHLEPRKLLSLTYFEQPIPGNADWGMVLDDLDGDGDIDFASASQAPNATGQLLVRLNDGNGNFGAPSSALIPITGFLKTFATGDFNGDGNVDIIIGSKDNNGLFFAGAGNGTFADGTVVGGMWNADSLWTTDFNGDGVDDIVADAGAGAIRLAQGNGDGTFQQVAVLSAGIAQARIIGLDDFNGNGIDDIAVYGSGTFQVWTGNGSGFTPGPLSLVDGFPALGDFNNDGFADLVWAKARTASEPLSTMRLALNPGDGRFDTSSVIDTAPSGGSFSPPETFDIDGDGALDFRTTLNIRIVRAASGNLLYTGDNAGGFRPSVELVFDIGILSGQSSVSRVQWADTSGDGALDAFFFKTQFPGDIPTLFKMFVSRVDPPLIGSVAGPTGPVTPGTTMTIAANNVAASAGRTVTFVRVYVDSNGNGTYDNDQTGSGPDALFGNATQDGSTPGRWSLGSIIQDNQFTGTTRFFVVATDSLNVASDPASVDVNFWSRIYFPDGWRSDDTITEILSLINPGATAVAYRIVVRYETGGRDAVVAQGTLAGLEKAQITLSQRGNAAAALVRGSVGYAIEVQSDGVVGASILHEDNFGSAGVANRVTNAEALNNKSANRWGFADVSTRSNDFVLFYNPFDQNIMLRVTISHATLGTLVIWQPLDALRRGGLNLREIAALAPNENYSVEITSNDDFAAAISRYADAGGSGFTALGQQHGRMKTFNWIETGNNRSNALVLFNPESSAMTANIEMTFNDPLATVRTQQVSVAAGERASVSLAPFTPAGATTANLKLTSTAAFYAQATTTNTFLGDAAQTQSPNVQSNSWAFADALFRRNQSEEWLILTNNNSVANSVTLDLIVNGTTVQRSFNIGARKTLRINLSDEPTIRVGPDLTSYAIAVSGQFKLVASMIRWDPVGGVGWQTLGTMTGPITFL